MNIVGERPRPWFLVLGNPDNDYRRELEAVLQTVDFVDEYRPGVQVRVSDYDAVVLLRHIDSNEVPLGINVIEFSPEPTSDVFEAREGGAVKYHYTINGQPEGVARRLAIADNMSPSMAQLTEKSLAPWLLNKSPRTLLYSYRMNPHGYPMVVDSASILPIVRETDGRPCAGLWLRPTDSSEREAHHWWFPEGTPSQVDWIKAALEAWERIYPDRFPVEGRADWTQLDTWRTSAELLAAREVQEAQALLEKEAARLQAAYEAKVDRLDALRDEVNAHERLLLTAQGDELKDAVSLALADLGFKVVDSDEAKRAAGSALLEDLVVSTSDGTWKAIVEVRGYARGAKTSDFQRLARAARGYERDHGREPDGRLYIVNHHLNEPPDKRPRVLQGADPDISEFAEDAGLVIDTRDLFRVRERVKAGANDAKGIESYVTSARGLFDLEAATGQSKPVDS